MESCHSTSPASLSPGNCIALVGNPNVGKSVLFQRLTGQYVTVSNYPGTTVEITQGAAKSLSNAAIIDTPGIVSFPARSEDEAVTARLLLDRKIKAVLQVGDAKNLHRTLHLTIQLAEMGLPMALALNMVDEASARGLSLNPQSLSAELHIAVVPTVATRGSGLAELQQALKLAAHPTLRLNYPQAIEQALASLEPSLPEDSPLTRRALGLAWLNGDEVVGQWLEKELDKTAFARIEKVRAEVDQNMGGETYAAILATREAFITSLVERSQTETGRGRANPGLFLSRLCTHPVWGLPILALVLAGMFWFVGVFGAGTLVELLEEQLFGQIINPWMTSVVESLVPWPFLSALLVGPYGLWTMGVTYAVALLLPIVFTFFITFSILEDSGYLPRLAVLTNRFFALIGLNGQAVLPMVLGLGCVTMATMTTRIISSKRERVLVTLLLALAVPCSAQLGVVLGMLAGISAGAALIWLGVTVLILLLIGWLAARLMPGERTPLVVELPPLRWPVGSNVLIKTLARLEWYIKEAVPLFLAGTLLLYLLDLFHLLPVITRALEPVVTGWLGLPAAAASALLMGLLRRDFAATGLFVMQSAGLLSPTQVVVAIVTITLFVPCIASMFMMIKERGIKTGLAMIAFIFPFAILVGGLLARLLALIGWNG